MDLYANTYKHVHAYICTQYYTQSHKCMPARLSPAVVSLGRRFLTEAVINDTLLKWGWGQRKRPLVSSTVRSSVHVTLWATADTEQIDAESNTLFIRQLAHECRRVGPFPPRR